MLKHLNGWEMSKKVKSNCKIFVKHFSGTITSCMEDYIKPSLQKEPNHIILHVKGENCDVIISDIILRTDNKKFSQKGQEVNTHLKDMCKEKNIYLIGNTNKIKAQHLNKSKLHLNKRGSNILSSTFAGELFRILT